MDHLLLLTSHLNSIYHDEFSSKQITIIATEEQFRLFNYHHFRIIYHLSAARHYAVEKGLSFLYKPTFEDIFKTLDKGSVYRIYDPIDVGMKNGLIRAAQKTGLSLTFVPDRNFLVENITDYLVKPPFKLDPLYQQWRRQFHILMEGEKPIGGKYSFDTDNRGTPPAHLDVIPPLTFAADDITTHVIHEVQQTFTHHPTSHQPFAYPVTRSQALAALDHFLQFRLPLFGRYQDAMMTGEPWMVHSLLSAAINLGLLIAKEVISAAEKAYHNGWAPLNAVEGFIRQILGWREYIRGIYLKLMPTYAALNALNHHQKLPSFFYDANTSLNCVSTVVRETIDHAYNHHIQRLMIIGNIANLMAINPAHIRAWFNEMYIDSFDWVVTPNVLGMALFADGGQMSTKPYIASANYIHKMSNYCDHCTYDPKQKTGAHACPINALYYQFLERHEATLRANPRMGYMYQNFDRIDESTWLAMKDVGRPFLL